MSEERPAYEELLSRLERAEAAIQALLKGEIDTLIGEAGPLVVRYRSALEELERLRAEAEGLAREWQTTFDALPDGIWILDADQRVVRANRASEGLFHCPMEEAVGRHCFEIVHGTAEPIPGCPFCLMRGSLRREQLEMQVGGRWLLLTVDPVVDAQGELKAAVHVTTDITERKLSEEALRESEGRYRALVEQSLQGMAVIQDMRVVYANQALASLSGYSKEELLAMSPRQVEEVVHPEDRGSVLRALAKRLAGEEVPPEQEFRFLRKDGEVRWVRTMASGIEYGGRPAVQVAYLDITERVKGEEQRQRLQEQLLHAQRLESVGRLAGGVAHDFNNLLSVIMGYGEIVLSQLDPMDPLKEDVRQILEAGRRASELTRQLLAFSRKQPLRPMVLDLNDVLSDLEKILRRVIGEDIELELRLSQGLGRVMADPGQMEQVIMNLAVNARDAMPDGGRLIIETRNIELDSAYAMTHPGAIPGPHVLLSVTDTGCGMEKEVLDHLFEPFFTTKEKGKGTGLGLSTVYGIVKQSGGEIQVRSEPGKGATFEILLPRFDGEPEAKEAPRAEAEAAGVGGHILLVEDDPSVRGLIQRMLERLGYRVTAAASGGEALLLVEEKGMRFDLLMTDVVMPGMDGALLAGRLRKGQPDLKVLYMSGYADDRIAHRGVLDSGAPFIQKPFSLQGLAEKVRSVLGKGGPASSQG